MTGKAVQLAYGPVSMLSGLAAGSLAGVIFKQLWRLVAREDDAPDALQPEHPLGRVLLAACVQGAIFAVVKALIERFGAKGFERLTGSWPGE